MKLGDLPVAESFRICDDAEDRFEILVKRPSEVIVRNVQGRISRLSPTTMVRREGNLTRTPDGNGESKVSIATFPVSHYVNHRTMCMRESQQKGYVSVFIGDEQATPHFMRYRYDGRPPLQIGLNKMISHIFQHFSLSKAALLEPPSMPCS